MKKNFSPAGKSGLVKIFVFLILTAAAGQLRIFYLEGRFHSRAVKPAEQKIYKVRSSPPECRVEAKPADAPVEAECRKGFFSRLGIGRAPAATYIIPPAEEVPEIEILRER